MASDNGITIGQLTEQLNQKMDLPTGISQDTMDYVVEWKTPTTDDPTWFRKYKSGWLEQGGIYQFTGTHGSSYVVTLPKKFLNEMYTILRGGKFAEGTAALTGVSVTAKTVETFTLQYAAQNGKSYTVAYNWYACGQGAE